MTLTGKQKDVLIYLYGAEKGRQKAAIAAAIDSSPEYVQRLMTDLKKQGLVKVSSYMGWWTITEKGIALITGEGAAKFKDPIFSALDINCNSLLRMMSIHQDQGREIADKIDIEVLMVAAMFYAMKREDDIPVGNKFVEEEHFNQTRDRLNLIIDGLSAVAKIDPITEAILNS